MEQGPSSTPGQLSWQEQRQEAIRRQQQRWQQLHPEQQQQQVSMYPSIPSMHDPGSLPHYPQVPSPSAPPLRQAPDWAGTEEQPEQQRRQQQEEEDHRLAMQLAEQFAAEDSAATGHAGPEDFDMPMNLGLGSVDEDDWEQIARTASMARMAREAAGEQEGGSGRPASPGSRLSSQAAAAAGSTTGGLLGAGISALMAIAAQAAAGGGGQAPQAGPHTQSSGAAAGGSGPTAGQPPGHPAPGPDAAAHASSSAGGAGGTASVLGTAANALRAFLASRAAASQRSSGADGGGSSGGNRAGGGGGSNDRRWEDEQPGAEDLHVLQHLMQQLMDGNLPPGMSPSSDAAHAAQASGSSNRGDAGGSSSGFRVTRLPGGGFAATYSSSSRSGPGGSHVEASAHSSDTPFSGMAPMFNDPGDLLGQLLMAGARSAHANSTGRAGAAGSAPGFTHFDPNSGASQFEALGQGMPSLGGLEDLLGAIMGPSIFTQGDGLRYEDLVGLDSVHVTTPEEVLSSLPQSKYVEGRQPGDSDTCVICQTSYAAGDDLTHLPCLHAFHSECIHPWLQGHSRKCPVCKTDVC